MNYRPIEYSILLLLRFYIRLLANTIEVLKLERSVRNFSYTVVLN